MIKTLRSFSLVLAAMVSTVAFADEVTVTMSEQGWLNNAAVTTVTSGDITLSFDKGTGKTAPAYYTSGTAVRLYGGGTLTFATAKGTISQVVFTTASGSSYQITAANSSFSEGSFNADAKTWTGNSSSFTLTNTATSGHYRIQAIAITYSPTGVAVTAPTISGETPFAESTTVSISIPDGTTVYYTTDGTTPTSASTQYTEAFTLTADATTVKAVAIDQSGNASTVASKTFLKAITTQGAGTLESPYTAADVIALNAASQLPTGTIYVTGKVVEAVSGGGQYNSANYYISADATTTNQLLVYSGKYIGEGTDFTATDYLAAGDVVVVCGTATVYNGTLEMNQGSYIVSLNGGTEGKTAPTIGDNDKGGKNNPYTPAEVLALAEADFPAVEVYVQGIVVADVTGSSYNNANYYISADGTETGKLQVYRGKYVDGANFSADVTIKAGSTVLVKGKIGTYNGTNQIAAGSSIAKLTTTAIRNISLDADDAPAYNILGQRVSGSYKGIVIKGGKKFIKK